MANRAGRRPRAAPHRHPGGVDFGRKLVAHERLPAVSGGQDRSSQNARRTTR